MAMPTIKTRAITPREAAEIVFGTAHPTNEQLRLVYARMRSGALRLNDPDCPPARWTTNEQALAEFLAANQLGRGIKSKGGGGEPAVAAAKALQARPNSRRHVEVEFKSVYRDLWRDYFMAVMLRRRTAHRSRSFQHAVVAGQTTLLLAMVALLWSTVVSLKVIVPAEHRAIAQRLDQEHAWHQIDRWHAPLSEDGGISQRIRVQYRYRSADSKRVVHTDRLFRVIGTQVEELPMD
jgi:hypothetical protein